MICADYERRQPLKSQILRWTGEEADWEIKDIAKLIQDLNKQKI